MGNQGGIVLNKACLSEVLLLLDNALVRCFSPEISFIEVGMQVAYYANKSGKYIHVKLSYIV